MPNYVTVAEMKLVKYDGELIDLSAYSDPEIEDKIDLAEAIVESICGDIFYVQTATYLFDGNGLTKLFFQPSVPYECLSITSFQNVDLDGTTVLDTYVEGTDYKRYPYYIETAQAYDADSPRRLFGTGGTWPRGQKNLKIAGTWGRSEVPLEVKEAVKILAAERLKPGFFNLPPLGVAQSVWDDFTISFKSAVTVGQSSGYDEVDLLLKDHVNYMTMFQAVLDERSKPYTRKW